MAIKSAYGGALWRGLSEYAVWEPGRDIRIGDFGVIHEGCFDRLGSLKDVVGVELISDRDPSLAKAITARTESLVQGQVGGSATAVASVEFAFKGAGGVLLTASDSTFTAAGNVLGIGSILKNSSKWKRHWKIVTGVRQAENFCFIGSSATDGKINISGDPTVLSGALPALLNGTLNTEAGLAVTGSDTTHYIGKRGTLAVELRQCKWFGGELKRGFADGETEEDDEDLLTFDVLRDPPDAFNDATM